MDVDKALSFSPRSAMLMRSSDAGIGGEYESSDGVREGCLDASDARSSSRGFDTLGSSASVAAVGTTMPGWHGGSVAVGRER